MHLTQPLGMPAGMFCLLNKYRHRCVIRCTGWGFDTQHICTNMPTLPFCLIQSNWMKRAYIEEQACVKSEPIFYWFKPDSPLHSLSNTKLPAQTYKPGMTRVFFALCRRMTSNLNASMFQHHLKKNLLSVHAKVRINESTFYWCQKLERTKHRPLTSVSECVHEKVLWSPLLFLQ